MAANNIIYRGFDASFGFDLSIVSALAGVDLVGKTALFTVKQDRKADDTTAVLKHDMVISANDLDPDNDKNVLISFSAEQTVGVEEGPYFCDLKLFNPDGSGLLYIPYQSVEAIDDVTDRIAIS